MYGHAIAQVEPPVVGIHLIWSGPRPYIYSLDGWEIRRRPALRRQRPERCDALDASDITRLRNERELQRALGIVTLRAGLWPMPVDWIDPMQTGAPTLEETPCDVFTVELFQSYASMTALVDAQDSFVYGLREGKVVALGGPPQSGVASYTLESVAIDTLVIHARAPQAVRYCAFQPNASDDAEWRAVPVLARLQMPLRELIPSLSDSAAEYALAQERLLPGETLDQAGFRALADLLRAGVTHFYPPRPIDELLLVRRDATQLFEELVAVDAIRMPLVHPKWRRVLGFGYFDHAPDLVPGASYEYRITGTFPVEDLNDAIYGFHTVPSQTQIPADFYVRDLRMRLPEPGRIERAPGTSTTGLIEPSRRGLALHPRSEPWWNLPTLESFSLVIDFPRSVGEVLLELAPNHSLQYRWGAPWGVISAPTPVPPGERPRLTFAVPISQLRLEGTGFLFAVRVPSGPSGVEALSMVLPPVTLANTPRLPPPTRARIFNLQRPAPPAPFDNQPVPMRPRHSLGFEVKWRPPLQTGVTYWPPNGSGNPPIESASHQLERRSVVFHHDTPAALLSAFASGVAPLPNPALLAAITNMELDAVKHAALVTALLSSDLPSMLTLCVDRASAWQPLLDGDNWVTGDRDNSPDDRQVRPGTDLLMLFPEVRPAPPNAMLDVFWRDVFDRPDEPAPQPGDYYQYRVRSVDVVGRPSLTWRDSNVVRLEKHMPPPIPVAPEKPAEPPSVNPFGPAGVRARILIPGAPDLTDADRTTLGPHNNAILLQWGWHERERSQDPFAREFRVYTAPPLDFVPGTVTGYTTVSPGVFSAGLKLKRAVLANQARGLRLNAGYPFRVDDHTAGTDITATLVALVPLTGGVYAEPTGEIAFPLPFSPALQRPPQWSARVHVEPLTASESYSHLLYDLLELTPSHPRDVIWVGVSAADDQPYVPDQLNPPKRPGNESPIVPVICDGRYWQKPVVAFQPPLGKVPILRTPEPIDRPIRFSLDLTSFMDGYGFTGSDMVLPERASAEAILSATTVDAAGQVIGLPVRLRDGDVEQPIPLAVLNLEDRTAIVNQLHSRDSGVVADQYVVFIAGVHPYRDRLFERCLRSPIPFGAFDETLPPKGGRFVYRFRMADAASHLSDEGAIAKVIVRVPTITLGAAPVRVPPTDSEDPRQMWLRIPNDRALTGVVIFSQIAAPLDGPLAESELLRVPNAHDQYLRGQGLRVRASDGSLLAPTQVISLSAAAADEYHVGIPLAGTPGDRVRIWACTLTEDGIPSLLGGPWSQAIPLEPPAPPHLAALASSGGASVQFVWQWSDPIAAVPVKLERAYEQSGPYTQMSRIIDVGAAPNLEIEWPDRTAHYRLATITSGTQPSSVSERVRIEMPSRAITIS